LLTLYAIAKTWSYAFWRPRVQEEQTVEIPALSPSWGRLSDAIGATIAAERPSTPITPPSDPVPVRRDMPPPMFVGATAAVAFSIGLSIFAGPFFTYAGDAAPTMCSRDVYVQSVLPEEAL